MDGALLRSMIALSSVAWTSVYTCACVSYVGTGVRAVLYGIEPNMSAAVPMYSASSTRDSPRILRFPEMVTAESTFLRSSSPPGPYAWLKAALAVF